MGKRKLRATRPAHRGMEPFRRALCDHLRGIAGSGLEYLGEQAFRIAREPVAKRWEVERKILRAIDLSET